MLTGISKLPYEAIESHVLPVLADISIISIGELRYAGCESNFNHHTMDVTKYEKIVLQSTRDIVTVLWIVPLQIIDRSTHQSNN